MPTLDWIGKAAVVNHHQEVPYRLLHCDKERSVGASGEGNLLIQGDNLQALKALLPYYAGQVNCIYIDPTYNTGNEAWIYNDNVNAPEIKRWLGEVVGREAEDLSRHDKWLCMMYPRLMLLRDFLTQDGIIAVSIDDTEVANLRLIMEEVFGPTNFVANVVWQKRYVSNVTAKFLSDMHDHILIFAKRKENVKVHLVSRTEEQIKDYKNHDDDCRGPWRAQDLSASKPYSAGLFTIIGPNGQEFNPPPKRYWRCNQAQYEIWLADGRITFGKTGTGRPMLKAFLTEVQQGLTPNTWWTHEFAGHNKEATLELKQIFGGDPTFDTPKPVRLIKRIFQLFGEPDSIVLDSFAGSGTTGHAVLQLNKEDGGNRRFILTEMEPQIAEDVTAERLRRVICGYGDTPGLGGGFRFCNLSEPLFNAQGQINATVSFSDLAHHLYFTETGEPLPPRPESGGPFIGTANGVAYYLLWQGRDKETLLDNAALRKLPPHDGVRVVYADGCRVGPGRLKAAGVSFKQVPYEVRTS